MFDEVEQYSLIGEKPKKALDWECDILDECVVCGERIHAGIYPPVCCKECEKLFEIECLYNEFIKNFKNK